MGLRGLGSVCYALVMPRTHFIDYQGALTDEVAERLVSAARLGMPYPYCARKAGVSVSTLQRWLRAGVEGDPRYSQLARDMEHARACNAEVALKTLNQAAKNGDTGAAKWILQAVHKIGPSAEPEAAEVHSFEENAASKLAALPTDQLDQLIAELTTATIRPAVIDAE